ncbi:MAG: SMI1/KNR4 family protein [Saprospiraceae bacterium]|nr:SMI1/KNR4 family protein [Saprospiraceae bacterium]MCB0691938.1 SMI1/KNR4 family protein [Saprospiraceae bacterium]MCB9328824.1 SMI1/KNR4 family protein [Lewinellaceae bacterium]
MERLKQIELKIHELKKLDKRYSTFGANRHKFNLNKTKSESEIIEFERNNGIKLPTGYRNFIKLIGNGGAGPYYGLEKLEDGVYVDLDYKERGDKVNLAKPFKFTEKWNIDDKQFQGEDGEFRHDLKDKDYFKPEWADGMLRISNFGCGVSINLIVNGEEYGNIWADDRCNDQGILPFHPNDKNRVQFLDWYEAWLDDSLSPFIRIKKMLLTNSVENVIKDEWESKNYNIRSYVYNIMDIEPPKTTHHKPEYNEEMERKREIWLDKVNKYQISKPETNIRPWWKIW